MNPYRAVERTLIGLVILFVLTVLAALAYLITVTESWGGVGITIAVLAFAVAAMTLGEDWHSFETWWVRKRAEWDDKRAGSAGEKHGS
jgi:hypothetical protein